MMVDAALDNANAQIVIDVHRLPKGRQFGHCKISQRFVQELIGIWETTPDRLRKHRIRAGTLTRYRKRAEKAMMPFDRLMQLLAEFRWFENQFDLPPETWRRAKDVLKELGVKVKDSVELGAAVPAPVLVLPASTCVGSLAALFESILTKSKSHMTWVKVYEQGPTPSQPPAILFGGDAAHEDAALQSMLRNMIFWPREWYFDASPKITPVPFPADWVQTIVNKKVDDAERVPFLRRNLLYMQAGKDIATGEEIIKSEVYVPIYSGDCAVLCVNLHFRQEYTDQELRAIGRAVLSDCEEMARAVLLTRQKQIRLGRNALRNLQDAFGWNTEITDQMLEAAEEQKWSLESARFDEMCEGVAQRLGKDRVAHSRTDLLRARKDLPRARRRQDPGLLWAEVADHDALFETLVNLADNLSDRQDSCRFEYGLIDGMPLAHLTVYGTLHLHSMFRKSVNVGMSELEVALDPREFLSPSIDWGQPPYSLFLQFRIVAATSAGFVEAVHYDIHEDRLAVGIRAVFPRTVGH